MVDFPAQKQLPYHQFFAASCWSRSSSGLQPAPGDTKGRLVGEPKGRLVGEPPFRNGSGWFFLREDCILGENYWA